MSLSKSVGKICIFSFIGAVLAEIIFGIGDSGVLFTIMVISVILYLAALIIQKFG